MYSMKIWDMFIKIHSFKELEKWFRVYFEEWSWEIKKSNTTIRNVGIAIEKIWEIFNYCENVYKEASFVVMKTYSSSLDD